MFPTLFLLASHVLDQAAPTYTVQEVTIHKHFAGKLGYRIQTELTLSSRNGTVKVMIKDCKHSRFQSASSPLSKGAKVWLTSQSSELRLDQIKLIP